MTILVTDAMRKARLIDSPDYVAVADRLDIPGFLRTVADDPIGARCQLDRAVERWASEVVRQEREAREQAEIDARADAVRERDWYMGSAG